MMSAVNTEFAACGLTGRTVAGAVNYIADMAQRPRYYANDHSRDVLALDPRTVIIEDVRGRFDAPSLSREGYQLVSHRSAVEDFENPAEVAAAYPGEIERLVLQLSGADRVVVSSPGVLRFGEKSARAGRLDNSMPARFIHVVWRALSPPPQDVPLTICDARGVELADFMEADAVFDVAGSQEWSFEGWVVRYNPAHRWSYFSGMNREEALVFKTNDSDPGKPHCVPHCAFDDPSCPPGVPPRASIEMRAIAYWFAPW